MNLSTEQAELVKLITGTDPLKFKTAMSKSVVEEREELVKRKESEVEAELNKAYQTIYEQALPAFMLIIEKEILPYCLPRDWSFETLDDDIEFDLNSKEKSLVNKARICRSLYNRFVKKLRSAHNARTRK